MCDWCVVRLFGGTVLAVAMCSDCLELGLWMRGFNSVVKLLGGRVQSVVVLAVAVICDCVV